MCRTKVEELESVNLRVKEEWEEEWTEFGTVTKSLSLGARGVYTRKD